MQNYSAKFKIFYFTLAFFIFALLISLPLGLFAASDQVEVGVEVTADCNNNGVCEPGENTTSCPNDCDTSLPPPASTPTPTPSPGGGPPPTIEVFSITSVTISVQQERATITWETNELAVSTLEWGTTFEYTEETIAELEPLTSHSTQLVGLLPDTEYLFRIEAQNFAGSIASVEGQRLRTLALPDTTPPANVSDFTARPFASSIELSWQNPLVVDFETVRILKSTKFFPLDFFDGQLIYEGKGVQFTDKDVIQGVRYYYTAFSKDTSGNYSSGAIVSAVIQPKEALAPPAKPEGKPILPFFPQPEPPIPSGPEGEEEFIDVELSDLDFIQKDEIVIVVPEPILKRVPIEQGAPITILLDGQKVPDETIVIIGTIYNKKKQRSSSFLFKRDKQNGTIEAHIPLFKEPGIYPFDISFFNKERKKIHSVDGIFIVRGVVKAIDQPRDISSVSPFIVLILALMLLHVIHREYKRKYE